MTLLAAFNLYLACGSALWLWSWFIADRPLHFLAIRIDIEQFNKPFLSFIGWMLATFYAIIFWPVVLTNRIRNERNRRK